MNVITLDMQQQQPSAALLPQTQLQPQQLQPQAPQQLPQPQQPQKMVSSATNESSSTPTATPPVVVLNKQRLQELVAEIDPCEQLDEEVEDVLLQMIDDFIENLVTASCQMAKHRDSKTLEVKDVQLVLEKEWNMNIPGFGTPLTSLNRLKSHSSTTEAHKQRLALIKKTLKKT